MRANFFGVALFVIAACGSSNDPAKDLVSITVEPENATLEYAGTPLTLDYQAIGHYADGHEAPIPDAVFTLDADGARLGNFSAAQYVEPADPRDPRPAAKAASSRRPARRRAARP